MLWILTKLAPAHHYSKTYPPSKFQPYRPNSAANIATTKKKFQLLITRQVLNGFSPNFFQHIFTIIPTLHMSFKPIDFTVRPVSKLQKISSIANYSEPST